MTGKTIAFAFTVAIPMLLVRRMAPDQFGLYKQIFLVVNSAVNMLPVGFAMTAYYFLPREERYRSHTIFNIMFVTTAVGVLCGAVLAAAPATLVVLFGEATAVGFARPIAAVVVLWVVGSLLEIIMVANQEIRVATVAILMIQLSRAALFVTAALTAGTVRAVLYAAVLQGCVQVAVLAAYLIKRFPRFWLAVDWGFFRRQLAYAVPFGLGGLLYTLQTDLHNYFVSHWFGAAAYAAYSIGCFQLPLFGILADSVGGVMIPRVSMLQREGDVRGIVLLVARAMRKLAIIYFPIYAFLLVLRREFIVALFTERYLASVPLFAVNLTLIPLGIFLIDPVMRAYVEHRHFVIKQHAVVLAGLTMALPFTIARFGLLGAISTVVVFSAASRAAGFAKIVQILDVTFEDIRLLRDVFYVALAAAGAAVLTSVIRPIASGAPPLLVLSITAVWFALSYAGLLIAVRVVTDDERAAIMRLVHTALWRVPRGVARDAVAVQPEL